MTIITDFFLYPSDTKIPSDLLLWDLVLLWTNKQLWSQKGCWAKSCIFLLLSFSPPQGVPFIPPPFSSFCAESLQQRLRHWGSVPHKNVHFSAEAQTEVALQDPLSKQAQESLRWDFTPPCYLLLIPFPVKSTAPHLWIICTKFINGTKLDQLFIDAAKEKQEVRAEPGRQKRTEAFQMCQQREVLTSSH